MYKCALFLKMEWRKNSKIGRAVFEKSQKIGKIWFS